MKSRSRIIIANALVWAATMIAVSILAGDHEQGFSIVLLMLVGWLTTHSLVDEQAGARARCEWACLKRRFGLGPSR